MSKSLSNLLCQTIIFLLHILTLILIILPQCGQQNYKEHQDFSAIPLLKQQRWQHEILKKLVAQRFLEVLATVCQLPNVANKNAI